MKCYTIRIFPNKEQVDKIIELSNIRMSIWNKLIDIQEKEYKNNKKILSKFDLNNLLPKLKNYYPEWKKFNGKAAQTVSQEIFQSFQSFFVLIKKDKNARPPKKKEIDNDFHTIVYNQNGWFFRNGLININKIPLQYKTNIENVVELKIKEIRLKNRNNKWLVDLIVDDSIDYKKEINIKTRTLAIDLGIKSLGTGIDNNGNKIVINNKSKEINKYFSKRINNVKSKISKTTKNSKRNKRLNKVKNKLYQKKNTQIKQTLHIQSKKLVNMNYNTIVVGDLTVKKLLSKEKNKYKGLRKSFSESNISMFLDFLTYKTQKKLNNLTKINESYTTQINCLTGKKFEKYIDLSKRVVNITKDIVIDRDINSAINIMKRYNEYHLASMNKPLVITIDVLLNIISRETTYI